MRSVAAAMLAFALHCGRAPSGEADGGTPGETGAPAVVTLLASAGTHRLLAIDAANAYLTGDAITAVPLAGGAATTLPSPEAGVTGVATAAGRVIWTTASHVYAAPAGGG